MAVSFVPWGTPTCSRKPCTFLNTSDYAFQLHFQCLHKGAVHASFFFRASFMRSHPNQGRPIVALPHSVRNTPSNEAEARATQNFGLADAKRQGGQSALWADLEIILHESWAINDPGQGLSGGPAIQGMQEAEQSKDGDHRRGQAKAMQCGQQEISRGLWLTLSSFCMNQGRSTAL